MDRHLGEVGRAGKLDASDNSKKKKDNETGEEIKLNLRH